VLHELYYSYLHFLPFDHIHYLKTTRKDPSVFFWAGNPRVNNQFTILQHHSQMVQHVYVVGDQEGAGWLILTQYCVILWVLDGEWVHACNTVPTGLVVVFVAAIDGGLNAWVFTCCSLYLLCISPRLLFLSLYHCQCLSHSTLLISCSLALDSSGVVKCAVWCT
jgi:hypothetical protein